MSKQILFFSAPWCGPCSQMKTMLNESIQNELGIEIIDISQDIEKATKYKVMSVPTFVVLKDGKEVIRKVGGTTIDDLRIM